MSRHRDGRRWAKPRAARTGLTPPSVQVNQRFERKEARLKEAIEACTNDSTSESGATGSYSSVLLCVGVRAHGPQPLVRRLPPLARVNLQAMLPHVPVGPCVSVLPLASICVLNPMDGALLLQLYPHPCMIRIVACCRLLTALVATVAAACDVLEVRDASATASLAIEELSRADASAAIEDL